MNRIRQILVLCVIALAGSALAEVRLPSVFSDHMVLQRDSDVKVWGWADAGEHVTVRFAPRPGSEQAPRPGSGQAGQEKSTKAGADGKWSVVLAPMKASSEPAVMTVRGENELTISDVLVGEVWICSGQSNMEWPLQRSSAAQEAAADMPTIRCFKVPHVTAATPRDNVQASWAVATKVSTMRFTAVGYHFALNLAKELAVPVGLLDNSWGGSKIEPYISLAAAKGDSAVAAAVSNEIAIVETLAEEKRPLDKKYVAAMRQWLSVAETAVEAGADIPAVPRHPAPRLDGQKLAMKFNAMVNPLVPYTIRGALWYQGESNMGDAHYAAKMQTLINDWRERWDCGAFPFYYVQLAPFKGYSGEKLGRFWEQQGKVLSMVENTGMAVTTDIGTINNIHPPNKKDVGHRLAVWALHHEYGREDTEYTGPVYSGMTVQSNKVVLTFAHADGLAAPGGEPKWFELSGADRKFHPAKARIVDGKVELENENVTEPVAARMGWQQGAEPGLCNGAGLPASPFRTDDW